MFKDYCIFDNILKNPYDFVHCSKHVFYYYNLSNTDKSFKLLSKSIDPLSWKGYRSKFLHEIDIDLCNILFKELFEKIFPLACSISYKVRSYFHYFPFTVGTAYSDWWHTDNNTLLAGVIYLNEKPKLNSGTILKIDSKDITIENKFNRLVLYKPDIIHRPENGFGQSIYDSRFTIPFFIDEFKISKKSSSVNFKEII